MHHAVILACDPGVDLRPLTSEETPTAFLALGDRRTLLQRSIDRLVESIPVENLWVIVLPQHRARAEAELHEAIHVIADSEGGEPVGSLVAALSEITSSASGAAAVLLQPAIHVVVDEVGYRKRLLAGLDTASSNGSGVSFTVGAGRGGERATGIEAWPADVLGERLASVARRGPTSIRDALSVDESELTGVPLGDVGWIDVADWEAVRRLLEYAEKPWGHERLWALNRHYAGKILFIRAGESLSLQYHETKDETIRIAAGRMRFRAGPSAEALETVVLEPGMSYAVPPRLVHRMEALEDCTVIEVSTPHLNDVVRLEDRYGRA
jgi:mannose-6-phosphate isomerase